MAEGSGNVFANGIGVVRQGDNDTVHAYGGRNCSARHQVPLSAGAPTVFVNGRALGRIGDGGETLASGSPNVFAGNGSGGGSHVAPISPIPMVKFGDPNFVANTRQLTSNYVSNPNSYYNPSAAADGVKADYSGTADDASTDPGIVTPGQYSDIISFLQQKLSEAAQGKWRESGQGGHASNPNIIGIWSDLGFPGANSSPWNTDQTAWCMGFVNYALKASGYKWVPTASAQAITQNPGRWNATQIPKEQAQPGDIAFWSYRHVNFVYEKKGAGFTFVGGNQTPKGGSNNPDDGDITISYPGGTSSSNANWVSCWRPNKG
jgi:uncharacterized Zn-binding protein involved in type VI secretion